MPVTKLHFYNWCQLENVSIDLPETGLICIHGPNGKGKSNFIRGIEMAAKGRVTTGALTKEKNITWGQENGSTYFEFVASGRKGKVDRSLHSAKASMTWGDEKYGSSKLMEAAMETLIGSDQFFSTFTICHQGHLTDVLDARPAERMKLFEVLYGLADTAKCWDALGAEISQFQQIERPSKLPSVFDDEIRLVQDRLVSTKAEYDAIGQAPPASVSGDLANLLAAARANLGQQASVSVPEMSAERMALEAQLQQAQATDAELVKRIEQAAHEEAHARASIQQAQTKRSEWAMYRTIVDQRAAADKRASEAQQALANLESGRPSIDLTELEHRAAAAKTLLDAAGADYKAKAAELTKVQTGVCPTCGTTTIVDQAGVARKMSDIAASLAETLAAQVVSGKALREAETAAKAALTSASQEVNAWTASWQAAKTSVDMAARSLVGQQAPAEPIGSPMTEQEIQAAQAAAAPLAATVQRLKDERLVLRPQLELNGRIQVLASNVQREQQRQQQLGELLARLGMPGQDLQGEFQVKEDELSRMRELQSLSAALSARGQEINNQIAQLQKDKQLAVDSLARSEHQVRYLGILETARNALHRDRYSAEVIRRSVTRLNGVWNELLAHLGVPFTIHIDANLEIWANFSGRKAEVCQLSGGQRCAAALTFQVAANKLLATPMKLLVLDEPSYGLDAAHVDYLAALLPKLDSWASASGMQILLISHEERLRDAATHIIQL